MLNLLQFYNGSGKETLEGLILFNDLKQMLFIFLVMEAWIVVQGSFSFYRYAKAYNCNVFV